MLRRTSARCRTTSYPATTADPAVGAAQRAQHLDRRRLARAVGAEEPEDLARLDLERDLVHGGQLAVTLDEADDRDRGRRRGVPVSLAVESLMTPMITPFCRLTTARNGRFQTTERVGFPFGCHDAPMSGMKELFELMAQQHGVATTSQGRALGLTRRAEVRMIEEAS